MASGAAPRPIPLLVWSLLLLLVQSAFLFRHVPAEYRPDLYLLFALFLGVRFDSAVSLAVPFLLGLCHDALTLAPFGLTALVLVIVGYLPHTGRPDVYLEGALTQWILVVVGTGLAVAVTLLVYLALGREVSSPWRSLLGHLILNSALFIPLFRLWSRHLVRRGGRRA